MVKTANGLVRESGIYDIVGIIDSTKAGLDAGEYLDQKEEWHPIFTSLDEALSILPEKPRSVYLWYCSSARLFTGKLEPPKYYFPSDGSICILI